MAGAKLMQRQGGYELVDPAFVKAISHSVRVEILAECSLAAICVSEFLTRRKPELGRTAIEHHFSVLVDCGVIEEVDARRERGGRARYYAPTARALFSEKDFIQVPPALRGSLSASYFATLWERSRESLLAGTLDAHPERHLTWTPLQLDWEGFMSVVGELGEIFDRLKTTEAAAKERMGRSGEDAMHVTVGLMGFESPSPIRDHQVDERPPPS
jgi:DNA-binding transcriptional ArsR family regulator